MPRPRPVGGLPVLLWLLILSGLPAHASPHQDFITLAGVVTYDGPLPEPIPNTESGTPRPLIEVDPNTRGLQDAVVWLEGAPASDTADPVELAVMDQRNFTFVPHVLGARRARRSCS